MRTFALRCPAGLPLLTLLLLGGAGPAGAAARENLSPALAAVMHGGRAEVDHAISRLQHAGVPRPAMASIARMLLEGGRLTRQNAAYVFANLPEAGHGDTLLRALEDDDEVVRERACTALGRQRLRQAVRPLSRAAADPSPVVRREAVRALGLIGDRKATEKVLSLLEDPNDEVKLAAILAAGALGDRRAETRLAGLLKDPSETARLAAARSLCQLGNAEGRRFGERLLGSASAAERREGIRVVEEARFPWVREALLKALGDGDPGVAIAAARALAGLGDGRGVEWLVHAAVRVDPAVRLRIETALEELRLTSPDRAKILAREPSPGLPLPKVESGP